MEGFVGITVENLRQRCEALSADLTARGVEEIDLLRHAPGGSQNQAPAHVEPDAWREHPDAWLYHYTQLQRRHAVLVEQERGTAPDAALDQALSDAIASRPVHVTFSDGVVRAVYPKSYHALEFLSSLDAQVARIADRVQRIRALEAEVGADELTPSERRALAFGPLARSLAVRLWLWILTTKGPELPFDDDAVNPEPPAWTKKIAPEDLLRVTEAHLQVNALRIATIVRAFPSEGSAAPSRLRLSGFIGALAHDMGRNDLATRWDLGQLMTQALAKAETERAARRAAEAERSSRREVA